MSKRKPLGGRLLRTRRLQKKQERTFVRLALAKRPSRNLCEARDRELASMRIEIIGLRHYNMAKLGLPVPLIGHAAVEAFNAGIVNWQQLLQKEIALVQSRLERSTRILD